MMKRNILIAVFFLSILVPVRTFADDGNQPEKPASERIKSSLGLSYITSDGNAESQTLSVEADFDYKGEKDELEFKAGSVYGKSEEEKTADYWYLKLKYNHDITKKAYLFIASGLEGNRLSGYKTHFSLQPGLGYRFLEGRHLLRGEISPGYVHEDRINNKNLSYESYLAYMLYKFQMTDKAYFSQDSEYVGDFSDGDNYRLNTNTSIVVSITDLLSFKSSVKVKYVNLPPVDTKKVDTFTSTSLVFTF